MKFYADRNADRRLLDALCRGHDWDIDREMLRGPDRREPDRLVMAKAMAADRILITFDRDFDHDAQLRSLTIQAPGVLLLRVYPETIPMDLWAATIAATYEEYADKLAGRVLEIHPSGRCAWK